MTEEEIKAWLLEYAWLGDEDTQKREVDCIMAQAGWKHLAERTDRRVDAQFGDEDPKKVREAAFGMELSALYECHDDPHLETCPRYVGVVRSE
jgi:hypothetical protein